MIIKQAANRLFFKSHVSINNKLNRHIKVSYVDEIKKEWLVFANYELQFKDYENIKIRTEKANQERAPMFHKVVL